MSGRATRSIVRKAGDVIPEVVGPVLSARPHDLPPWQFPATALHAGAPSYAGGRVDTYCINSECPAQRVQRAPTSRPARRWTSKASASSG